MPESTIKGDSATAFASNVLREYTKADVSGVSPGDEYVKPARTLPAVSRAKAAEIRGMPSHLAAKDVAKRCGVPVDVVRQVNALGGRTSLPPGCGVEQVNPYECGGCRKMVVYVPCQVCAAKLYKRLRMKER